MEKWEQKLTNKFAINGKARVVLNYDTLSKEKILTVEWFNPKTNQWQPLLSKTSDLSWKELLEEV